MRIKISRENKCLTVVQLLFKRVKKQLDVWWTTLASDSNFDFTRTIYTWIISVHPSMIANSSDWHEIWAFGSANHVDDIFPEALSTRRDGIKGGVWLLHQTKIRISYKTSPQNVSSIFDPRFRPGAKNTLTQNFFHLAIKPPIENKTWFKRHEQSTCKGQPISIHFVR